MESDGGNILFHIVSVLSNMVWQIYWPLAFGLILSSFIRNLLPVETVAKHLGKTNVKSVAYSTVLGMVSSSCSYAAASLSHTLLSKKATLANAVAFLVSSTNLIVEMFIVLVALLGWTFLWGEVIGGLILIVTVAFVFQRFYPKDVEAELRQHIEVKQSNMSGMKHEHSDCGMDMSSMKDDKEGKDKIDKDKESDGEMDMSASKLQESDCSIDMAVMQHKESRQSMDMSPMDDTKKEDKESKDKESDGEMDMPAMKHEESDCGMDMSSTSHMDMNMNMDKSQPASSPFMEKVTKSAGFFQMDLSMIGKEILIGVVVSSFLIAVVPMEGWRMLFISNDVNLPGWLHSVLDVVIGIFVAVIAYVCSVGNLLLAAALWHGGISFGGVIGFILADVLTIPMMRVYQKYYGTRPAKWMVGLLFVSILFTGLCVDAIFNGFNLDVVSQGLRTINQDGFGWNFTTIMNLIFIPLSIWYYRLGQKANAGMGMNM